MSRLSKHEMLEILYEALRANLGVIVTTNDPELLRRQFYSLRAENPELLPLSFVLSPLNPSHLWILRKPDDA